MVNFQQRDHPQQIGDGANNGRDNDALGALATHPSRCPRADLPGQDAARTRTLACAVAALTGMARRPGGPSTGARCAYDWRLAHSLCSPGATSPGLRAKRWLPPALDPAQQAALKEAVESAPASAGVPLANWTW